MVGRRTPMVVSDHTNGTEVPMRTLTAVQRRYGISPNKIYRLVFSGERTMVDDRQDGGTVEISVRYASDSARVERRWLDEGGANRRCRYRYLEGGPDGREDRS